MRERLTKGYVFYQHIGNNLEVYVDDIVVKSEDKEEDVKYLKGVFREIRRCNMRLNPNKCVFGVERGTS